MRVLLLGATGRTGKLVLQQLIDQGFNVNVIVRDKAKVIRDGVKVFEGDVRDESLITQAVEGCEAVISVLNISRMNDFPWSRLRTPQTLLSDTMKSLLKVSEKVGINRIIVCSAWGVHETKKDLPGWFRWFIDNSNIGAAYQDHERLEDLLKGSLLNYTIIRPVGLINSNSKKEVRISQNSQPKPSLLISRREVAEFMVKILRDELYIRAAVTISRK